MCIRDRTSAGTDATRVASYDPWVSLAWLVTGKTLGGTVLYPQRNLLDRETALRMWTENTTWFSNEEGKKGRIEAGMLADLAVLDRDYFSVPGDEIRQITAVLTIVDGKVVFGAEGFESLAPPLPPAMPEWSPVNVYGGYNKTAPGPAALAKVAALSCGCATTCGVHGHDHARSWGAGLPVADLKSFWGALGCACWAV